MKQTPYRAQMWAVMRDGETYMILPTIDAAETHLGIWSKNGFSKYHWTVPEGRGSIPARDGSRAAQTPEPSGSSGRRVEPRPIALSAQLVEMQVIT